MTWISRSWSTCLSSSHLVTCGSILLTSTSPSACYPLIGPILTASCKSWAPLPTKVYTPQFWSPPLSLIRGLTFLSLCSTCECSQPCSHFLLASFQLFCVHFLLASFQLFCVILSVRHMSMTSFMVHVKDPEQMRSSWQSRGKWLIPMVGTR